MALPVGQLSRRIEELLREHHLDPSAWQGEVQSLASLEAADERAAQERFQELKRALLVMRRANLLRELAGHSFAAGLPGAATQGMDLREVERENVALEKALRHARAIAAALDDEARARARLRERALAPPARIEARAWDDLAPLAQSTEDHRRLAMREARVEDETLQARRRAAKLTLLVVDVPATPAMEAGAALAALDACARALDAAERVEDAHARAIAPLRAPDVRAYRATTRRELEREARALALAGDLSGLDALRARSEALAREAATLSAQAARARRTGAAAPRGERKAGDAMDGYG